MLIITNEMQRNTIFFIAVKTLNVSGGFSAHHQELKNCTYNIWYLLSLVAATASVVEMEMVSVCCSTTQKQIPDAVCTVFELLMIGGETA
jgi:hypothetical protein